MFKTAPHLPASSQPSLPLLTIAGPVWDIIAKWWDAGNPLHHHKNRMGHGYFKAKQYVERLSIKDSPGIYFTQSVRASASWVREIFPFNPTDRRTLAPKGSLTALEDAELLFTSVDQALGCQENKTSLGLSPLESGAGRVLRKICAASGINFI